MRLLVVMKFQYVLLLLFLLLFC